MRFVLRIVILLWCVVGFSQRTITGYALNDTLPAIDVQVLNLVTEKTAVSDGQGKFQMEVSEGDMLVFPAKEFEYKRYLIEADDIKRGSIKVKLVVKPIQLDEVVVKYDINPEDLGLVPKGQKILTPAQKKVYGATSSPLDALLNLISGRTKMLRKIVDVEKKERYLAKLDTWFNDAYFVEKLKIPKDYVGGFRYYCVEFQPVAEAIKQNNKLQAAFVLSQLAQEYNKLRTEMARPEAEIPEK